MECLSASAGKYLDLQSRLLTLNRLKANFCLYSLNRSLNNLYHRSYHIIKTAVIAVGDDGFTLSLELCEVVDD